jgi:metal transporter CNNM
LFIIAVEPFTSRFISSHILARLLNVQFYHEFEYDEDRAKEGNVTYIYEYGRPADYFVLILNGQAELVTGKEKIVSEVGPFSYFGVSALCVSNNNHFSVNQIVILFLSFIFIKSPDKKVEDVLLLKDLKFRPFIPDFSLRVCGNVQILRIRRKHWLAAIRATFFQNKQEANGGAPMLNPDGEQIDLLTQELEKANCVDRPETSISPSSETNGKKRDRAMSLAPTTSSGRVIREHKDFFSQLYSISSSHNMDKIRPESPTILNLNTPSLISKQRHHLSRADPT